MGNEGGWGFARQVTVVIGAFFQVLAPVFVTASVSEVSGANRTLVVPANYAFVIWGPIFLLCFAYAAYQALPSNRDDLLLGQVGWWLGSAFLLNGVWEIVFPARLFLLSQGVFLVVFVCLFVAYRRLVLVSRERALGGPERWLVALPLGLLFGWVTIANFVSVATTLVGLGLLEGGVGEALLGSALLLRGLVGAFRGRRQPVWSLAPHDQRSATLDRTRYPGRYWCTAWRLDTTENRPARAARNRVGRTGS